MRLIRKKIPETSLKNYQFDKNMPIEKILFLDIETTGFAARTSILYLIGCAYYEEEEWQSIQWFATTYEDEKDVVKSFFEFAKNYKYLIHFNGNNFDLPFIMQKCKQFSLPYHFDDFTGIDIYKRIAPLKKFLKLPNCKQKTLEEFLGIDREDPFSGGELIDIYHGFVKEQTEFAYDAMICHNADDLKGMLLVLPILSYSDLFTKKIKVKKVQANHYSDLNGQSHQELYMKLSLPVNLPKAVSYHKNDCYFTGEGKDGTLKVPLYEEEMKYFYSNYKDYYYLPIEDMAIHKSVATFVDKNHRMQALASNCYTRKQSLYLQQWDMLFEPFFKRDYSDPDLFFELTDEFKTDRNAFHAYASHVLNIMAE